MKRSIISTLLAAAALGLNSYRPPESITPRPKRVIRRTAGSKNMRRAEFGTLTMRHPGGIVSQTFRDIQQRNFLNLNV